MGKDFPFYLIREGGFQDTIIESSQYNTTVSNIFEVTIGDGKSGKIVITQDYK